MKTLFALTLLLTGCATCQEHPVGCTAMTMAGALIATSAVMSFRHEDPPPQRKGLCGQHPQECY